MRQLTLDEAQTANQLFELLSKDNSTIEKKLQKLDIFDLNEWIKKEVAERLQNQHFKSLVAKGGKKWDNFIQVDRSIFFQLSEHIANDQNCKLPHLTSRVLNLIIISVDNKGCTNLTSKAISEQLQVAQSSVSTCLTYLKSINFIDHTKNGGDLIAKKMNKTGKASKNSFISIVSKLEIVNYFNSLAVAVVEPIKNCIINIMEKEDAPAPLPSVSAIEGNFFENFIFSQKIDGKDVIFCNAILTRCYKNDVQTVEIKEKTIEEYKKLAILKKKVAKRVEKLNQEIKQIDELEKDKSLFFNNLNEKPLEQDFIPLNFNFLAPKQQELS